jgi:DNA-directed RNA polymerase subunit RPC12/RpoP
MEHGRNDMSTINLEDAKVSYEGQNLPAIHLISKLQTQLQEAACRMAVIASTLGDLQAALLNSNTVEVKLTLSKEDYGRFRSLGGMDDSERVRKAVMTLIHPEESEFPPSPVESRPAVTPGGPRPVAPPVEFRPEFTQAAEPVLTHDPEPQPVERIFHEQPISAAPPIKQKSTTKCPRCQSLIDLPETSNNQWSVEIKCGSCGVKYLVKSKPDDLVRNQP